MKRRERMVAVLALGLGCGLRSSEQIHVRPEDVTIDETGVHVTVSGKHPRVVTCTNAWSDRLAAIVEATRPGHPLTSPWRATAATARGIQNVVRLSQITNPAMVAFSPRSLRNTWLVERLTVGTPVPTLIEAAGVESIEALKAFLVFIPTPTPAERAAALRWTR